MYKNVKLELPSTSHGSKQRFVPTIWHRIQLNHIGSDSTIFSCEVKYRRIQLENVWKQVLCTRNACKRKQGKFYVNS